MAVPVPRVVIVGGGFGGLAAARALRRAPVEVILIDRTNHHLFQPLLYQVATSVLTPGQIGWPIRNILRRQKNTTVILGEVTGVNKEKRYVVASSADRREAPIPYDYLVLATGARQSYFAHDEFERFAPGLKTLRDAVAIRNHILPPFQQADGGGVGWRGGRGGRRGGRPGLDRRGASGGLGHGRLRRSPAGREAAPRRRPGRDAAGALRGKAHRRAGRG